MTASSNPLFSSIDFNYRPRSYFFPMSAAKFLLATIKGTQRRLEIEALFNSGNVRDIQDWMTHSALDDKTRKIIGHYHPVFLGGEYLTDLEEGEVEIARLELASTTDDVTSVRARRVGDRIYYRVSDEYLENNSYTCSPCWSKHPITLQQLIHLIETTTDRRYKERSCGLRFLDDSYRLFDYRLESCRTFLNVSSEFYPALGFYYDLAIEDWYQQCVKEREQAEADDDTVAVRSPWRWL